MKRPPPGSYDGRHTPERFPLAPLLACTGLGASVLATAAGFTTRSASRWHHAGLTPSVADAVAIAAGLHPVAVWGDAWLDVEAYT